MNYLKDLLIVNAIVWFWVSSVAHTDGNTVFAAVSAVLGILCIISILLISYIFIEKSNKDEESKEKDKNEQNS